MRWARVAAAAMVLAAATTLAVPSEAGWLSRIVREAADGGGGAASKLGKAGLGSLDSAAAHVAALPKVGAGTALAAHLTPEGHWKFVNREGQVFTAATPDELARVGAALAPDAAPGGKLAYYLSEETVFTQRAALKDLPETADLHIVVGRDSYRLRRSGSDLAAEYRPNVFLSLSDRRLFEETAYRLSRPLNRSNIRTLALETGGPQSLSSAPRFDPATKAALIDQVDPTALPQAFSSLRGQTALVSGRLEGSVLTFRSSNGGDQTIDVAKLVKAAEEADVNLVLLATGASRQPGGRNWLWQTVEVSGLNDALKRATFADFLSGLAGTGSELTVNATSGSFGRVTISAVPTPAVSAPLTDTVSGWIGWDDLLGEITGNVAMKSVEVFARDEAHERELDARIIPGIPATAQYVYLGSLIAGLLAFQVSFPWWRRIWPREDRQEYSSWIGYALARVVRLVALVFVFLPIVGMPALMWLGMLQIWGMVTVPFRLFGWLRNRFRPQRA